MISCGPSVKTFYEPFESESKFTQSFSPSSSMQAYLSRARNHKKAYLGDDKIEYPTCIYSKNPSIRDFSCAEKEKLKNFVQSVINEYVIFLYGRYGFNVKHVTLINIMEHGQPCRNTYYGQIESLRLKPIRLVMDPTTGYAGYAGSVNMALHQYVATAPDFMVDWSPGPGLGYYESTSSVVRHELGHCWGLHHEVNVPSAIYGVEHSQNKHRIFGDDINGVTHVWRAYIDPDYKDDCPVAYKKVTSQGPSSGSHFPKEWGCLPDVKDLNTVRIKNKDTNKCLIYPSDIEGVNLKQEDCDKDALNQRWDVLTYDNYGRHIICSSIDRPLLCVRSENFSKILDAHMELGFVDEAYSPWYLIPNEDGTWMLQQPETVQVMYASSNSVTDEVIKQRKPAGDAKERWYIKKVVGGIGDQRIYNKIEASLLIPAGGQGPITSHVRVDGSSDDIMVGRCEVSVIIDHPQEEDLRIDFLNYHRGVNLRETLHEYGLPLRDFYDVPGCNLDTALGTWSIAIYDRGSEAKGTFNGWKLTINKSGP